MTGGNEINLYGNLTTDLATAKNWWNSSCQGVVPQFQFGSPPTGTGTGSIDIEVKWGGTNPFPSSNECFDSCGCAVEQTNASGEVDAGVIWVFDNSGSAPCFNQDTIAAHEIGHILGLDNPSNPGACTGHIMGPVGGASNNQQPNATLCAAIDDLWQTDWESSDPCDQPNPPQGCDNGRDSPSSPIVIDLDRNQFHLTGLNDPVAFDIDADGAMETLGWTGAEALDAFLCLDRNDNGTVDSGAELFGNFTPRIDGSTAANGYIPLAEFDFVAMGGNENGFIDPEDVIYSELQLWIDWNHNGFSEPGEFLSLAQAGITRIDLQYRFSRRHDQHGNYFRYLSRAWILVNGHERRTWTSDVFFVVGP